MLRFFKPGQFFGHRSLLADEAFHARALVIEDCTLRFVSKEVLTAARSRYPAFNELLLRQLALELRMVEQHLVEVLDHEVIVGTAQALVFLKSLFPEHDWTRQEIANFCASTVSTVIKALGKLEQRGFIAQSGRHIELIDPHGLIALQDKPW